MTRNDTLDKLKWSIRPRSGTDSAQWDLGIMFEQFGEEICSYRVNENTGFWCGPVALVSVKVDPDGVGHALLQTGAW